MTRLEPLLASASAGPAESPQREAVLAALNGVMGDRLAESGNPFATQMSLRLQGTVLDWQAMPAKTAVTGEVLVLIHGLCMNELQWPTQHSDALASAQGYTPVYVRYNTGLHISQNGAALSQWLEALVKHWPVKIKKLTVLAHSMGGLVIRSALHQAGQAGLRWPKSLKNIVFLGTAHHWNGRATGSICSWAPPPSARPSKDSPSYAARASPTCVTVLWTRPTG